VDTDSPLLVERSELAKFVREVLGCRCPDEVFEQIVCPSPASAQAPGEQTLVIGRRLLLRLVAVDRLEGLAERVARWAAEGQRDRDAWGLNRFRLVLVGDDPSGLESLAHRAFAAVARDDERMHLHLVHWSAAILVGRAASTTVDPPASGSH
jgi:hypothetical protein